MNNVAQTRNREAVGSLRLESLLSAQYVLPSMLALNTAALFALDRVGGIPAWVKAAAALFLAF
ncbi:MAG TPA: hypothetical protein VNI54_02125 [Thermoanaerobaculia bacterium]|nr:hypothetical protein [Thermoanaerobaculia bacterium]